MMRAHGWVLAGLVVPTLASAQDVSRPLNYQTLTSPSYQAVPAPGAAAAPYKLPEVKELQGASGGTLSTTPTILVKRIVVEGVTAFDSSTIAKLVSPYENKVVSSADLQSLRAILTKLYVINGYVSSGVLLPDQQVKDGVVTYRAVEGKLSRVELDRASTLRAGYVAPRVYQQVQSPLNIADVQHALRNLQQDPNVRRLDARLLPGQTPGESVLALAIDDAPRFRFGLGADNHRSSSTGADRATAFASIRNLTGYGEELQVSAAISDGADEGSVLLSVPFTSRDATLTAYYSRSDATVIEERFADLDIESDSKTWGVTASIPLIGPGDDRLSLALGFEANESLSSLLGVPFSFSPGAQDGESRTSVGIAGLDWLSRRERFVVGLRATYMQGLDVLDATVFEPQNPLELLMNPTGADGEYQLVQLTGVYMHRLGERVQLASRMTAQLSQDPLMSLSKLAIGGYNTVRGYPENLLVRDNGVAATIELQVPMLGYRSDPHPLNLMLVPFVDYGRSWDEADTDPGSDTRNTDVARYIASAGLGLRWNPFAGLEAQVYWGHPIADNFDGDDPRDLRQDHDLQDDGVHFAVTYSYRW